MSPLDPVVYTIGLADALNNADTIIVDDEELSIQEFNFDNVLEGCSHPCVVTVTRSYTYDELAALDNANKLGLQMTADISWK